MYRPLFVLFAILFISLFLGGCTVEETKKSEFFYPTPKVSNVTENTYPDPTITLKEDSNLDDLDKTLNDLDNLENVSLEPFSIEEE